HLRLALDADLDLPVLKLPGAKLLAEAVTRAPSPLAGLLILAQRAVGGEQGVEYALLHRLLGRLLDRLGHLLAHEIHGSLDEIAHHALYVAPEVADLGELRRLHLDERRANQRREPPGDLRLPHARRAA